VEGQDSNSDQAYQASMGGSTRSGASDDQSEAGRNEENDNPQNSEAADESSNSNDSNDDQDGSNSENEKNVIQDTPIADAESESSGDDGTDAPDYEDRITTRSETKMKRLGIKRGGDMNLWTGVRTRSQKLKAKPSASAVHDENQSPTKIRVSTR